MQRDPYYVQEDDNLDDMAEVLKPALDFTDEDLAKLSPEAKNLFSGRRRLGINWLDRYEVVVTVTDASGACRCGMKPGQKIVFDMRHTVKPDLSDAPLCMHLMAPVLSIFYMTFDRAAEGLNPLTCIWRFVECPITGPDHGAGKALAEVTLRCADTHEVVTKRMLAEDFA